MSSPSHTHPCRKSLPELAKYFMKLMDDLKVSKNDKFCECMRTLLIQRCRSTILKAKEGQLDVSFLEKDLPGAIVLINRILMPPPAPKAKASSKKEVPSKKKKTVSFAEPLESVREFSSEEEASSLAAELTAEYDIVAAHLNLDIPSLAELDCQYKADGKQ